MKKRNKAFTLTELLAVIIVLAIVAIVSIPIAIDVIDDVRKEADLQTVYGLIDAASIYYTEALIDDTKKDDIIKPNNIYHTVYVSSDIPNDGYLYANREGKIALSIVLNGTCYKKEFYEELEVIEDGSCDLGFVGVDDTAPTVNFTISDPISSTGWYTTDIFVSIEAIDNESKIDYFNWCIGENCTPTNRESATTKSLLIEDSPSTQVCVIAYDKAGNTSDKVCSDIIKKDTLAPSFAGLTAIQVGIGESIDLVDGVTVTDATSGVDGTYTYSPTSIDTSLTSKTTVKYEATDIAGNTIVEERQVVVSADAPYITFEVLEGTINSNGWAKEDFYVTINIQDNSGHGIKSFNVCTATSGTCDPTKGSTITGKTTASRLISYEESNNRVCVQATDNYDQTSAAICSDIYKLDKTKPTAGTINIVGKLGDNDWYITDVAIEAVNGSDALSGHLSTTVNTTSITEDTKETTVIVTTLDNAGNESTREYKIKVDKSSVNTPVITASDGITSGNWHTADYSLNFTTSSAETSVSGITYYYGTSEDSITKAGSNVNISTNIEGTTYYVKACNAAGACSDIASYVAKLDKNTPSVTITKSVSNNKIVLTASVTPSTTPSGYSYQWYKDGSAISGATSLSYTTAQPGTYKIIVTTGTGKEVNDEEIINSYTITYNMNGGSATIANQTKIEDLPLVLSIIKPTRTGYDFLGWSTSATATSATYESGESYNENSSATLYAVWKSLYDGLEYASYNVGDTITYQGIDFLVVSDNGETVTLVTKSNVGTGAYGNSTSFAGSTADTYLNNTWVNNNAGIKSEIASGAIVLDSETNTYVRLLKKSELSTSLPNLSGTNFWTLTANGSSLYYGLPDGSSTYTKYTASSNITGTCYSGKSTDLTTISKSFAKNSVSSSTATASALPTATTAVTSTSYTLSASGTCLASYSTSKETVAETCNCTGTSCSDTYECTKQSTFNTTLTTSTITLGSTCTGYNCTKYNTNYSVNKTSVLSKPSTTSSWCTKSSTSTTTTNYIMTTIPTQTAVYYSNKTTSAKAHITTSTKSTMYYLTTKTASTQYYTTKQATNYQLYSITYTTTRSLFTTKTTNAYPYYRTYSTYIGKFTTTKATQTSGLYTIKTTSTKTNKTTSSRATTTGKLTFTQSAWVGTGYTKYPSVSTVTAYSYTTITNRAYYKTTSLTGYTTRKTTSVGSTTRYYGSYSTSWAKTTSYLGSMTTHATWSYSQSFLYTTRTTSTQYHLTTSRYSTSYQITGWPTSTQYYTTDVPTATSTFYTTSRKSTSYGLGSGCVGTTTTTISTPYTTVYYSTPTTTTCAGSTCAGYNTSYSYNTTVKQTSTPYTTTCGTQSSTCSTCDTCDVDYTVYTASGSDASWERFVVSEQTNALGYRAVITVMKKD